MRKFFIWMVAVVVVISNCGTPDPIQMMDRLHKSLPEYISEGITKSDLAVMDRAHSSDICKLGWATLDHHLESGGMLELWDFQGFPQEAKEYDDSYYEPYILEAEIYRLQEDYQSSLEAGLRGFKLAFEQGQFAEAKAIAVFCQKQYSRMKKGGDIVFKDEDGVINPVKFKYQERRKALPDMTRFNFKDGFTTTVYKFVVEH